MALPLPSWPWSYHGHWPCWQVQDLCPANKWRLDLWKGMVGYIGEAGQNGNEKMAQRMGFVQIWWRQGIYCITQISSILGWQFFGFRGAMVVVPDGLQLATLTEIWVGNFGRRFKHPKRFGFIHVQTYLNQPASGMDKSTCVGGSFCWHTNHHTLSDTVGQTSHVQCCFQLAKASLPSGCSSGQLLWAICVRHHAIFCWKCWTS